jgi:hypothetical protein
MHDKRIHPHLIRLDARSTKQNLKAVRDSTFFRMGDEHEEQMLMGFPISAYRSIVGMFLLAVLLSAGLLYLMGAF